MIRNFINSFSLENGFILDKHGQVDEWASVIKNQEEIYKKEVDRQKIERRNNQRQYYADLKKGIEDK